MNEPLIALLAVLCNVAAQLSMKAAADGGQPDWLSPWLVVSVVFYGGSFLLTVRVFAANPLSVATPVMAGATFLLIALASVLLLGERVSWITCAGMGLILLGIAALSARS